MVLRTIAALIMALLPLAAHAQEKYVLGAPTAMTGPYAFVGVSMEKGIRIAVEEINAAGGVNGTKLDLLLEDTASDRAQTVTLARRMALKDRALAIIGPNTSTDAMAAGPLVMDLKIPMITNTPSPAVRKIGEWIFTIPEAPSDIMVGLAKFGIEQLKIKKIAFVSVRDNILFSEQRTVVRDHMAAAGAQVVADDTISSLDSDFTALSTKIASAGVDAISLYMPPEQAANLLLQARQAGLSKDVKLLAPPGHVSQPYLTTGGKAVEGTYLVADYHPGTPSELNRHFVEVFKKRYNTPPDNWAAVGYNAVQLFKTAALKAAPNVTRESLRGALSQITNMPSVLGKGKYSIGPERAPSYGGIILVVKDGAFVPVN